MGYPGSKPNGALRLPSHIPLHHFLLSHAQGRGSLKKVLIKSKWRLTQSTHQRGHKDARAEKTHKNYAEGVDHFVNATLGIDGPAWQQKKTNTHFRICTANSEYRHFAKTAFNLIIGRPAALTVYQRNLSICQGLASLGELNICLRLHCSCRFSKPTRPPPTGKATTT